MVIKKKPLLAAWMLAAAAGAHAGVLEQESFYVSGDCAPQNTLGVITEQDDFNIIFSDMTATSSGSFVTKSCFYEVKVKVPAGYQIAADAMALDGGCSVGTDQRSHLYLDTQYQMDGYGSPVVWRRATGDGMGDPDFSRGGAGSFSLKQTVDQPVYAPCGEDVVFTGYLHVGANGFGTELNLDQSVAMWDWQVIPCNSFPTQWYSTYRAAGGQQVDAEIDFTGDTGTYTLESGPVGTFSNVQYAEGSRTISGLWQLGTAGGWFRFELNQDQTSFRGEWGRGQRVGFNRQGAWNGSVR